jgi:hypothetical protein
VVTYRHEYRGGVEAAVKMLEADFGDDHDRLLLRRLCQHFATR